MFTHESMSFTAVEPSLRIESSVGSVCQAEAKRGILLIEMYCIRLRVLIECVMKAGEISIGRTFFSLELEI